MVTEALKVLEEKLVCVSQVISLSVKKSLLLMFNYPAPYETELWLICLGSNLRQNPCSGPPPVYKDLNTYHDLPLVDLPTRLRGNSKLTSGN